MTDDAPIDETTTHWHILTVTVDGKVSILKNLDAPTARQAYQHLNPRSRPLEFINAKPVTESGNLTSGTTFFGGSQSYSYEVRTSEILKVHILGPDGVDLQPWKDVPAVVIDLGGRSEFE